MRVVVVVSKDKSDIFFANQLMKALHVVGVVVENQTPEKDQSSLAKKAMKYVGNPPVFLKKVGEVLDRKFIDRHQSYNNPEFALSFGEEDRELIPREGVEVLYTRGVNDINEAENCSWIKHKRPDVIAVCGASIMRDELLAIPTYGVLNLHGGLSQFYRGLFPTDWAIHNGEPECVGATVHFVSPGVDDGDVIYQGRPSISGSDNPNSLYEKVVRLGVRMMIQAISDLEQASCHATALVKKGDLYLNHMFDVQAKRRTWQQIKDGVLADYIAHKSERDQRVKTALINEFQELDSPKPRSDQLSTV
ncbi:formyl transferase [Marinobacter salinisoli]|uniref:phosphoribosylglycinamide formyltransferase 1 n=1 Tax=Marinobacter salinisoli TaxID=2769486 RepID=A0ABX7MNL2_9GAMM|nr:formyl transferase [Marinobacter salinisoli]QSP93694.1 formyl transferase [Marinobacter salinisoli]